MLFGYIFPVDTRILRYILLMAVWTPGSVLSGFSPAGSTLEFEKNKYKINIGISAYKETGAIKIFK
jgi:hypothetical protein